MSFTFPHFNPKPEFVQPDYRQWHAVQVGMSREEVVALLGPPLKDKYRGGKPRADDPYYSYGYLQLPMLPHPRTYSFLVGFNEHKVFTKIDPFNGRFSVDGAPTTPELFLPTPNVVFSHYPRVLDCRWFPSSGEYPMTYLVELGCSDPRSLEEFPALEIESDLSIAYFVTLFGG